MIVHQEAFSIHCLMPALHLLVTIQELSSLDLIKNTISKPLEDLIIQKILLPSRTSFFNSRNRFDSDGSDDPSTFSIDLLAPLAKYHDTKAGDKFKETKGLKKIWPTSLIFQIAVQNATRITPKQRSVEDSWLQDLFGRILQQAHHIDAADAPFESSTQHVLPINKMLRQIADHDIRINRSKLEPFLDHVMTCPDGTLDASVICESINSCILVDASIFIGLAAIPKDLRGNNLRAPNHLLATLLSWITNSAWKLSLEMDLIYEDKLLKVVLPLVKAFAKARSLLDFISFWQEQLALCQEKRSNYSELVTGSCSPKSLWEDERVMQMIARQAESTLTAGQIYNLILGARTNVISHENLGSDGYPNLMANLILLDLAFAITLTDENSDQIKDITRDIYHSTLGWLVNKTHWPVEHKWRLWRILIARRNYWNPTENCLDSWDLEQQVVGKAMELTTRAQSRDEVRQSGYAEEFYAFAFLTSFTSGQKVLSEQDRKPLCDLIEKVIEWMFDYDTEEKHDETRDQQGCTTNPKPVFQWNGQSDGVTSVGILHLCYLAQFLVFPAVFQSDKPLRDVLEFSLIPHRLLEVKHQHRIFQNIYRGAINFRSSSRTETKPYALTATPINYHLLWSKLVNIELLQENQTLKSSEPYNIQSKLPLNE